MPTMGIKLPKFVKCEGSNMVAHEILRADLGTCPACGQAVAIYDSTYHGDDLVIKHERKTRP